MNALTLPENNALAQSFDFDMLERMAAAMAKSGLFGMKTTEQALGLMLVAQAEQQHPASIAQDYDIIQGKATRKTHSVLARFQTAGGQVEWHQLDEQTADATFSHRQGGSLRMTWTFAQAQKAGLAGKDNWKHYPRAMLRARCIAEGVRAVYPAAIGGMMVPEEAMDMAEAPPGVKHMGAADVVESAKEVKKEAEPYPQDQFDKNLKAWGAAIVSGKATPEAVIAKAGTKGVLTEDQKAAIRALPGMAKVTYAQVADRITKAADMDALGTAGDLIGEVADPAQRVELSAMFDARNTELQGV